VQGFEDYPFLFVLANVIISDRDARRPIPTIIDFGISIDFGERAKDKDEEDYRKQWAGTPAYMAPDVSNFQYIFSWV
jgi:serine/threonine protein kinase